MSVYVTATLSRLAQINNYDDYEEMEDDEDFSYDTPFEKIFIKPLKKIAKKYDILIEHKEAQNYSYNGFYIVLINNLNKNKSVCLPSHDIVDLPIVNDDNTFYERTEAFIKVASDIIPEFKDFKFGEVGKRLFTFS